MFSIPHQVANIFISEEKIVNVISRSSSSDEVEIFLQSWTSRHQELNISNLSKEDYYEDVLVKLVGNPVHVFNLMDRTVNLLPKIMEGMVDSDREEISEFLESLPMPPDSSDLEGAMQALVRVQFTYKWVREV